MWNIRRLPAAWAAALTALTFLLVVAHSGCGDEDASPLSAQERQLLGTWRLDLGAVDRDDLSFTYTFRSDHTLSNRVGGAFLRRLRESEALRDADLGRLSSVEQIDGAEVTWAGIWSVAGDSLEVLFDLLEVDVLGRLPVVGEVSVPVYLEALAADEQVELTYQYQVGGERLALRGAAASAGMAGDAGAEAVAGLDPMARAALEAASEAVLEAYVQSDVNEFVYLRD